jgi:hypothetical protein
MESKQTEANPTKTMKQCLRTAATIRRKLKGRTHSNSAELLVEDHRGTTTEPRVEQEFTLEGLLAGVTKENRHSEVSYGAPVGKEKC